MYHDRGLRGVSQITGAPVNPLRRVPVLQDVPPQVVVDAGIVVVADSPDQGVMVTFGYPVPSPRMFIADVTSTGPVKSPSL